MSTPAQDQAAQIAELQAELAALRQGDGIRAAVDELTSWVARLAHVFPDSIAPNTLSLTAGGEPITAPPQPGFGQAVEFTAVTPEAGGGWSFITPSRMRVLSVYANPVTSAVVGNREYNLQLRDAANLHLLTLEGGPVIPASTEREIFYIRGIGAPNANNLFTREYPLWDFLVPAGYKLKWENFGAQAGDASGEQRIFGELF